MRSSIVSGLVVVVSLSLFLDRAQANLAITLGVQDFTNGQMVQQFPMPTGFSAGQTTVGPSPMGEEHGIDGTDTNSTYDQTWTFSYAPIPLVDITGAAITIGIWEHDSAGVGDQVEVFSLDSTTDLTAPLNTQFESYGGTQVFAFPATAEYNVYSIALPQSTFSDLSDGTASFRLRLQNGVPVNPAIAPGPDNYAGLDFSTLNITVIPEPSSCVFLSVLALTLLCGTLAQKVYLRRVGVIR